MSKLPYAGPGGLKVKDTIEINVKTKIDAEQLWNNTLEIYKSSSPWIRKIISDDYDGLDSTVEIWIDDPKWDDWMYTGEEEIPEVYWSWDDLPEEYKVDSTIQRSFTVNDMSNALEAILASRLYHCGQPITSDLDDWDACCGDYVIQFMFFGKLEYS